MRLGKVVGVSGTMIHHWEKERTYPKSAQIKKLAAALDISVAFLTEVRSAVRLEKEFADDFARSTLRTLSKLLGNALLRH